MKSRGLSVNFLTGVLALVAIAVGIYLAFFQKRGFEKMEVPIASVDADSESAWVEYDVDGTHYIQELDSFSGSYKVGKIVTIYYDPKDPGVIHTGGAVDYIILGIGIVLLAATIFSSLRSKKTVAQVREAQLDIPYAPSVQGEMRHLYFATDTGTYKFGHRIEDADRRVLYEGKVTKFHLLSPVEFEFIDHEHNRSTPHAVGQTETSEYSSPFSDDYSTFDFDGEDIWDHIKRSGIRVESRFMEGKTGWPEYDIYREGALIAHVESSSYYVHEEDAQEKGKLRTFLPARGYYRIDTREQNLDLLFVVLLAFARTSSLDGDGGNFGLLFRRKKKK